MPIRPELRTFYGPEWAELSHWVRFVRAKGRCETCGRPHGLEIHLLPDGRWFDTEQNCWRDPQGQTAVWPDLFEAKAVRVKRFWLSTAHLDSNPANNDPANLAALCAACHLNHDRPYHRVQIRLTIRLRYALGDLFEGPYVRPVGVAQARIPLPAPPVVAAAPVPKWLDRRSGQAASPPRPVRQRRQSVAIH